MKKAFSLLELILIILVISIILAFALPKFSSFFSFSSLNKLKVDYILIQNTLNDKINSNILLQEEEIINSLDEAQENRDNEKLFSKILDKNILSTSKQSKTNNMWIKESNEKYVYILNGEEIEFSFVNNSFLCQKPENICKDLQ